MSVGRSALAVAAAGAAASLTDWFFFGVLFHDKYQAYPEVWRVSQEGNQAIWAVFGFFTCAVFTFACGRLRLYGYSATSRLALWMWLGVALPIVVTDALFLKLHPLVAVAHSLGWLARLQAAAVSTGWILRKT